MPHLLDTVKLGCDVQCNWVKTPWSPTTSNLSGDFLPRKAKDIFSSSASREIKWKICKIPGKGRCVPKHEQGDRGEEKRCTNAKFIEAQIFGDWTGKEKVSIAFQVSGWGGVYDMLRFCVMPEWEQLRGHLARVALEIACGHL